MSAAHASGDEASRLRAAIELGNLLTTARREREGIDVLASVEGLAHAGPPEALGWWLLHRGTARQYLDDRASAQRDFDEALRLSHAHDLRALESYVLHHRGRCYVETDEIDLARASFLKALEIREALGDPRQSSTRRALEALGSGG